MATQGAANGPGRCGVSARPELEPPSGVAPGGADHGTMRTVTTYPTSYRPAKILSHSQRERISTVFESLHPVTQALMVVVAGLVVLGALGAVTYLAATGKGTEAIGALLLGLVGLVLGRLRTVERNTNGTTSKLIDHAIGSTVQGGQSTTDDSAAPEAQSVATQGVQR